MAQLNKTLFSSAKEDWATPQDFFDKLNEEFHFDLDPCADAENAKCKEYFTKEENGLLKDWGGHSVFCNPPYGRTSTGEWIRKCYEEAKKPGTVVVALIPARTDTRFFHDYIYHKAEIRFIKGRLKFGGCKGEAPFPSMVVIFGKEKEHFDHLYRGASICLFPSLDPYGTFRSTPGMVAEALRGLVYPSAVATSVPQNNTLPFCSKVRMLPNSGLLKISI